MSDLGNGKQTVNSKAVNNIDSKVNVLDTCSMDDSIKINHEFDIASQPVKKVSTLRVETEDIKTTSIKINDFVEKYYRTFYTWKPETKTEFFIFNLVRNSILVSVASPIILYFWSIYCNYKKLGSEYIAYGLIVLLIIITMHFAYFFIGSLIFNRKLDTHSNKSLKLNWGMRFKLSTKNELEMLWIEKITGGNQDKLDYLIKKVTDNMRNRQPDTRNLEHIFKNTIKNPYVTNSFVIIFTVILTLALSPLLNEINGDNFTRIGALLSILGVYSWVLIPITIVFFLVLFRAFLYSYELTTNGRPLILWRYEKLIKTLSNYQSVDIFEYLRLDGDEKAKIEQESQNKIESNDAD